MEILRRSWSDQEHGVTTGSTGSWQNGVTLTFSDEWAQRRLVLRGHNGKWRV